MTELELATKYSRTLIMNYRWKACAINADMLFQLLIADGVIPTNRMKAIRDWQKEMDALFQEDEV